MGGPPTKLIQVPPVVYRKLDPFEYNFPDLSTSKDTSNLAQYGYNSTNDHVWEGYSSAVGGSLDGGGRYLRWLRAFSLPLKTPSFASLSRLNASLSIYALVQCSLC